MSGDLRILYYSPLTHSVTSPALVKYFVITIRIFSPKKGPHYDSSVCAIMHATYYIIICTEYKVMGTSAPHTEITG